MKTNRNTGQILKALRTLAWVTLVAAAGYELWALCHWQQDAGYVVSQQAALSQLGQVEVNFSRIGLVNH